MFHSFYGCRRRYAYAHAGSQSGHCATPSRKSFYETRHARGGQGGFGVRRPVRYLGYKLDLDDDQMRRVAAIMDALKTEREQARLDESRTVTEVASLVTKEGLSVDDLRSALAPRISSTEKLNLAVARAVQDIVELLDVEQRQEFAYLLNSKSFTL